jgi:lysozyme family protein
MTGLRARIDEMVAAEGPFAGGPGDDAACAWGLSPVIAAAYGYEGAAAAMTAQEAQAIWWARFVAEPGLDLIEIFDPLLARVLLDGAVECGVTSAVRWLQVALNALGGREGAWPLLEVNGRVDAVVMHALRRCLATRGDPVRQVLAGLVRGQQSFDLLMEAVSAEAAEVRSRAWAHARAFAPTAYAAAG